MLRRVTCARSRPRRFPPSFARYLVHKDDLADVVTVPCPEVQQCFLELGVDHDPRRVGLSSSSAAGAIARRTSHGMAKCPGSAGVTPGASPNMDTSSAISLKRISCDTIFFSGRSRTPTAVRCQSSGGTAYRSLISARYRPYRTALRPVPLKLHSGTCCLSRVDD
jgi:hypothetical protein